MRLIDADTLKEKIKKQYKDTLDGALSAEFCCMVDKMPTLDFTDDDIPRLISEFDGKIYNGKIYDTKTAELVCMIDPCMADKSSQLLMRTENGDYFTCRVLRNFDIGELKNYIKFFGILPTTLDDAEDYIMEFYTEEYDRIKPILDAEREKSAKNKKE